MVSRSFAPWSPVSLVSVEVDIKFPSPHRQETPLQFVVVFASAKTIAGKPTKTKVPKRKTNSFLKVFMIYIYHNK
jgi:hypothetical protein